MARGNLWIYGGLLLVAAALCMTAGHFRDARRAAENAARLTVEVGAARPIPKPPEEESPPAYLAAPEMEMPAAEIAGNQYIGTLSLPALGRSLPVMGDWSYAKLELAPCRYSGSAYLDDMVIAAHNYPGHFGGVQALEAGDAVLFSDMAGNLFAYAVTDVQELGADDQAGLQAGEWALTLFTCTPSGAGRVAVRCVRLPEGSVRLLPFGLAVEGRPAFWRGRLREFPEHAMRAVSAGYCICFFLQAA